MRQRKFKYWDGTIMHSPGFELNPNGTMQVYNLGDRLDYRKAKWLEYTGLKDKNGADICENDILQYEYEGMRIGHLKIVEWKETPHYIGFNIGKGEGGQKDLLPQWTIVGNIWENPELVKSSKTR